MDPDPLPEAAGTPASQGVGSSGPPSGPPTPRTAPRLGGGEVTRAEEPGVASVSARRQVGIGFGRYRLINLLGEGGMGVVWKAHDPDLDRRVAIKFLHGDRVADPEQRARFFREARLAARLRHPGIVTVHDVGERDGEVYLCMDFVEGRRLEIPAQIDGPDVLSDTVERLAEVAEAVAYAHRAGVIHRDLKPDNVLVDAAGRPHVTDFGLAKEVGPAAAGDSLRTAAGMILGTPSYLAPEQAQAAHDRVCPASDVWALGVMLYEALAGRLPFAGVHFTEVLARVVQAEPVPPRRLRPGVPVDLEAVCLKALEKDPARRYPEAGALAAELRRWLAGEPVAVRRPGPVSRLWALAARNRAALLVPGIALVLTVGALGWLGIVRRVTESRVADYLKSASAAVGSFESQVKSVEMSAEARDALAQQTLAAIDVYLIGAPVSVEALALRGRVRELLRDYDGAARDLDRACAFAPDAAAPRLLRGLFRVRCYQALRGLPGRRVGPDGGLLARRPETAGERELREAGAADLALAKDRLVAGKMQEALLGEAALALYSSREDGARRALQFLDRVPRVPESVESRAAGDGRPPTFLRMVGADVRVPAVALLRGLALFQEDRLDEALREFDDVVQYWPLDPDALTWRGDVRAAAADACGIRADQARARRAGARADYDEALRLAPRAPGTLMSRGCLWTALGEAEREQGGTPASMYEKAIGDFTEALLVLPENPVARFDRGNAWRRLAESLGHRPEEAREALNAAIADYTAAIPGMGDLPDGSLNRGDAWLLLGVIERQRGGGGGSSLEAAVRDFDECVRRDPGWAEALAMSGSARGKLASAAAARGEDATALLERAEQDFAAALERRPDFREALRNRAAVRLEFAAHAWARGEDPAAWCVKALEPLDVAVRLPPGDDADDLAARGAVHALEALARALRNGDPEEPARRALADYGKAERALTRDPMLRHGRGMAWHAAAVGQRRRGLDATDALARAESDYRAAAAGGRVDSWVKLATLLRDFGRPEPAARALEEYARAMPGDAGSVRAEIERLRGADRAGPGWLGEGVAADRRLAGGDWPGARAGYERALAGWEGEGKAFSEAEPVTALALAGAHYNLACIASLQSAGKENPAAEPVPIGDDARVALRERALEHLEVAYRLGFADRELMRKDTTLDPVRDEARFRALLEGK